MQTIDLDILKQTMPAVNSISQKEGLSSRYQRYSTIDLLEGLYKEGFRVTYARQQRAMKKERELINKHIVRLRRVEDYPKTQYQADDPIVPEIVLVNSHDGSTAYQIWIGLFRFVCMNGMIVGDVTYSARIQHTQSIESVVSATMGLAGRAGEVVELVSMMKERVLAEHEKIALARKAYGLRFQEWDYENKSYVLDRFYNRVDPCEQGPRAFDPSNLLRLRRGADRRNDLFTVFNVIQENLTRTTPFFVQTTRNVQRIKGLTAIGESTRINRELWNVVAGLVDQKWSGDVNNN